MKYVYLGSYRSPLCAITDEQMQYLAKIKELYEARGKELFGPIGIAASSMADHKFIADKLEDIRPSTVKNAFWADWCRFFVLVSGEERGGECVNPTITVMDEKNIDSYLRALDVVFKESVQSTKGNNEFICFNFVGTLPLDAKKLMLNSPFIAKDGTIVTKDMTSCDFKKVLDDMELMLASMANAEYEVNATEEDLDDLERRLRKYAETAEQNEFVDILRAEGLINKAKAAKGTTSEQFLRNKAMFEVLRRVFHDPNASKYIDRKGN